MSTSVAASSPPPSNLSVNRAMVQRMSATIAILSLATLIIAFNFIPGFSITSTNIVFVAGLAVAFFILYLVLPRLYLNETFLMAGDALYVAAVTYFAAQAGQYGILILFLYFVIIVADALKYPISEYIFVVIVTLQAAYLYIILYAPFPPPIKIGILALFAFSTISIAVFVWYFISQTVYERSMRYVLEKKADYLKSMNTHLKAVDAMRSNMMHVTSHEFQTPLAAIKNSLTLLESSKIGSLSPKQLELVRMATTNNQRLQGLVRDLLDTARIQSGDWKLELHDFDLATMAQDVVKEYQPLAENKKINFKSDFAATSLPYTGDQHLIRLAMKNLVDNAIKYTPEGGTVTVSFATKENEATFRVADTGIGMNEVTINKLWQQFSRDERAIASHPDGYGIGLYYTKLIVERHHGSVGVKSHENEGSTFWITLPLHNVLANKGGKHAKRSS